MPEVILLAATNGSGKSTASKTLLSGINHYLNADEIAKGLTADGVLNPDITAGRILLRRWEELKNDREDFAVETTLATRAFAPRLRKMQQNGYRVAIVFLWIPDAELAIRRVSERVIHGGHSIPEDVIRRRYSAGPRNFFTIYRAMANVWRVYDNSSFTKPKLIARGNLKIQKEEIWYTLQHLWG